MAKDVKNEGMAVVSVCGDDGENPKRLGSQQMKRLLSKGLSWRRRKKKEEEKEKER